MEARLPQKSLRQKTHPKKRDTQQARL